jgi:MiaB/RimO family radical SAM methylthiotransferase
LQVYVGTNGCIEGQLSSTYVKEFFKKNKLTIVSDLSQADMVLFWACGLTEKREKDSLLDIKEIQLKMKSTGRLVVWGCLPKINPQSLSAIYSGPLVGPDDKGFFESVVEKIIVPFDPMEIAGAQDMIVSNEACTQARGQSAGAFTDALSLFESDWERLWARARKNTNYFIRIASGCTGRCAYCSERCVFGKIKSRSVANIVSELDRGLKHGYNRFSLIATDLGAYGKDMGYSLSDLLREMIRVENNREYKIILNQVNPFYLKEQYSDLGEIFASGKIAKLNCPVQSGSERILKLMGRMHTAEEWKHYMAKIARSFPNIQLSTHFMVGFPTETKEDFKETLRLLDYPICLDNIVVFKFSGRPRVYATRITSQIPEEIKELRRRMLLQKHACRYVLNAAIRHLHNIF